MCVIIGAIGNKKVNNEMIEDAWYANPDGAGIAWREGGKVKVVRGFMEIDLLKKAYKDVNTFPHILHFRLATSGLITPTLTHPFPCDGSDRERLDFKSDSVLFHNGFINDWQSLLLSIAPSLNKTECNQLLNSPLNDTKVVSYYVEKCGEAILQAIDGKWIVLTPNKLMLYGDRWVENENFVYSNTYFMSSHNYFVSNLRCKDVFQDYVGFEDYCDDTDAHQPEQEGK